MIRVACVLALGACAKDDGPVLDQVTPAAAARNATVTLTGQRLCGPRADCTSAAGQVQIGLDTPVSATIATYGDRGAQIVIPPLAPVGTTELVVIVNDRASNALPFEVLP